MTATKPVRRPVHSCGIAALVGLVALLVVALAIAPRSALGAPKPGAGSKGHAARIAVLSPKPEARVGGTLQARVRVSTTAGFTASLAGHNVTERFHRDGRVMEARLRRGRDFDLGANSLLIAAGNGRSMRATTVHFFSRSRADGLLAVTRPGRRTDRTPVRFRISVASPVAHLKVTVDHHRVPIGPVEGHRSWTIEVGASDGLRFGRNTLRVAAERADRKHFDRETVHFEVRRSAPLVGAGPDRSTRPGKPVVLDGRSTEPSGRGGALLYRWQIVDKPRGSHAGIVGSTRRAPRLMPDLPGVYRVRLTAARSTSKAAAERRPTATASAAESAVSPEPVCLPNLPVPLTPPSTEGQEGSEGNESRQGQLTPLEAPICVTPTGETSSPPLPLAEVGPVASDTVEVTAAPTQSPMGVPLEAIASDGSIRVGPQAYQPTGSLGFAHMIAINKETLTIECQETFTLGEASKMQAAVTGASPESLLIFAGMPPVTQGPPQQPEAEALGATITALGGSPPSSRRLGELVETGNWSALGFQGEAGYFAANLSGATEQTPIEATIGSKPGSLNGRLQPAADKIFSYVSAEFVPLDTAATRSSETKSVFTVGEETLEAEIPPHSLGLHIGIFDGESPNGKLTQLANLNYTLLNGTTTNVSAAQEAANELKRWRTESRNVLIVMQTYGTEVTAPQGAPLAGQYWVNDALFHPTEQGLYEWREQPYVSIKHESETEAVLDRFWNQLYPTVAGQVGDLTGPAGHDLVANFGVPDPEVEISQLTMVASNHAQDPEGNYVRGAGKTANGTPQDRLVATLARNDEGGWTVQTPSAAALAPSMIWETAYAAPTAWPDSQSAEDQRAMQAIARQIFGRLTMITDIRTQYLSDNVNQAQELELELERLRYEKTTEFTEPTFEALRKQLAVEVHDVVAVKNAIGPWKSIYGNKVTDLVQVNTVASTVITELLKDAHKQNTTETELNPEEIFIESLYTASELAGFPPGFEEAKLPVVLGLVASSTALAQTASPETKEKTEGPESETIRLKASEIGTKLAEHAEAATAGLEQLERLLVSDWGKLSKAAPPAREDWKLEPAARIKLEQSLAINTERQLYEGLLPEAFQQWVISPYFTATNPGGPTQPGTGYLCHPYFGETDEYTPKQPFESEPTGGLSTATYRAWFGSGATAAPAQPYTQPFSIRALKSTTDPLRMQTTQAAENVKSVQIKHDGSSPTKKLIDPLFEAVRTGESLVNPSRLGINKTEFFGDYGGGPSDWKRTICALGG